MSIGYSSAQRTPRAVVILSVRSLKLSSENAGTDSLEQSSDVFSPCMTYDLNTR